MSITMHIGLLIAEPAAERYGVPLWFLVAGIVNDNHNGVKSFSDFIRALA